MSESLKGKVAIVTGSGQGIGRGIAIYLARQGVKVITNNRKPGSGVLSQYTKDDMPEEDWNEMISLAGDAQDTANLIRAEGGEATPCFGDITKREDAERIVNFAVETYGSLDILVNNAAGTGAGAIYECTEENYLRQVRVKLTGTFNMMHFASQQMIKQGCGGRIINASSEAWMGLAGNDAYASANGGVVSLTWSAAKELWRHGITVNVYCPQGASPVHAVGFNAMVRRSKEVTGKDPDPAIMKVVHRNHGDPVGIGPAIAYLASDKASYISGAVFATYASGTIKRITDPIPVNQVDRPEEDGLWTLEELDVVFREKLLGKDYVSPASIATFT